MIIEGRDGLTHINIYSQGDTHLGRYLSNWYKAPFECADGKFDSIEGYWYWLGSRDDRLRTLSGYQAKQYGRKLPRPYKVKDFEVRIKKAIICKLIAHPYILEDLNISTLPFAHYYIFNGYRKDAGFDWLVSFFEDLRKHIKKESISSYQVNMVVV